jgi:hypothetical protein
MPETWEYREPERRPHPPAQVDRPAPWHPQQYDPAQHRQRLTPPEIPLDLSAAAPGFSPAAGPQPRQQFSQAQYVPPPPRYAPPQPPYGPPPRRKKNAGLKVFAGVAGGFLLLIVIVIAASPSKPSAPAASTTTQAAATAATAVSSAPAAAPADTQPAGTVSQMQALATAENYLGDGQGFSRQGLIDQLDSSFGNSFSVADATWAVDHSDANWDAQAVDCAKGYMNDGQGFSRQGLIQQMTSTYGNKFTEAQATYAANAVGL